MLYLIIGLGLFFILLGFILNEQNAETLMSGYNSMSDEERKQFDLKSAVALYRKFHLILGLSFIVIGSILYFISIYSSVIFLVAYPILAYMAFIVLSMKHYNGKSKGMYTVSLAILGSILLATIILGYFSFKENQLVLNEDNIQITGIYGETILYEQLEHVTLLNELPEIKRRSNGVSVGDIHKGLYTTEQGAIVKLILNSDQKPILLLERINGRPIYYSSGERSNEEIYQELQLLLW